jgi:hypothetical protein
MADPINVTAQRLDDAPPTQKVLTNDRFASIQTPKSEAAVIRESEETADYLIGILHALIAEVQHRPVMD